MESKVRAWSWITLGVLILAYAARIAVSFRDPGGLSRDFLCFWAVSALSLAGEPAAAYDAARLLAAERAIGSGEGFYTWSYPPTFQLLVLPLSLVPPLLAQLVFAGSGALLFAFAWRRLLPQRGALLVVAASSLFVTNLYLGQTGIWLAALYLIGLGSLAQPARRWPLGAAAFGVAAFKPHLGLLVPVTLLVTRSWHALALASAAAVGLALASLAAFGTEPWTAFFAMARRTLGLLEASGYRAHLLATFFSALRSLGVPLAAAYAIHGLLAAVGLALALRAMLRCREPELCAAVAIAASLLVFPYAYYYDLMVLAAPLAVLVREALHGGWLAGERAALVALWFGPLPLLLGLEWVGLSLGVVFPALTLALLLRRAAACREAGGSGGRTARSAAG